MSTAEARNASVNLHDAATFQNGIPHDVFAEMRNAPGLTWSPAFDGTRGFWSVTRHEDLVTVSRDTATYSSGEGHIQMYDIDEDALEARASMIDMDPPVHTHGYVASSARRLRLAMCRTIERPLRVESGTLSTHSRPLAEATGSTSLPNPFRSGSSAT